MLARSWLLPIIALLGACNMVISETPMFDESDRARLTPKNGIWIPEVDDCDFDASQPEDEWTECAVWVVVRNSGRELLLSDGKGQTERHDVIIASGNPPIIQGKWIDEAKEPRAAYFGFYGLEWQQLAPDVFAAASTWPVQCGIQAQSSSAIRPFPGISAECRPSSKEAIRSAAAASRTAEQVVRWQWLRPEGQ